MAQAASASPSELERLSDRLSSRAPHRRRRLKWSLIVFSFITGVFLIADLYRQLGDLTLGSLRRPDQRLPAPLENIRQRHIATLEKAKPPFDPQINATEGQRLLDEAQDLYLSHPEDPAFYQTYVTRFAAKNKKLPPDYEETWRRIDPYNGFWPAMTAAIRFPDGSYGPSRILDALLASPSAAQDVYTEASRKLKWIDYRRELTRREREAYMPAKSLLEDRWLQGAIRRAETQGVPAIDSAMPPYYTTSHGHLEEDEENSAAILTWLRLDTLRLTQPGNALPVPPETGDSPIPPGIFRANGGDQELEPAEAFARHQNVVASVMDDRPMSAAQRAMLPTLLDSRMFLMNSFEGNPFVSRRQAEFCMFARLALLPLALLAVALFFAAGGEILRRPKGIRCAAYGLQPLLPSSLQGKLLLWSIAAPVLLVSGVLASPLGGWDLDWHSSFVEISVKPLFTIPLAGGVLLSLGTLLHLTDREASKHLTGLAAARSSPWLGRISILVSLVSIFTAGIIGRWLPKGLHDQAYSALFALLAIPLLLVLWEGGAALFRPREAALSNVMKARLLLPCLATLTAVLLAAISLSRVAEARALTRDPSAAIGPDATRYENARSSRLTAEFRQVLTAP